MENTLFIALSKQLAIRREMDVIANNLANTSSPGFKNEQMMFVEYLKNTGPNGKVSLVQDISLARDLREGIFKRTNNTLDVAIHGKGWFVVDAPNGERYTRNGHFRLNQEGELVTATGHKLMTTTGEPIVFEPGDNDIIIKGDGKVTASGDDRGTLRVVTFENERRLEKVSGNLFRSNEVPDEKTEAEVVQGVIEESNVQPIIEITRMIKAMRSYQGAQSLIDREHDRQRQAIDKLTRER
jgi:flagellar basal-body rod protein FlgF